MSIDIEKIKRLREKLGLTLDEAAKRAGLTNRQFWHGIENGTRHNLTVETLEKVAAALNTKAKNLLK